MVERSGRRGRRIAVVATIALLVLGGGGVLALHLYVTPERARAFAERNLSESLSREVRIGGAGLGLWPRLSVTAREVSVAGAPADTEPLAEATRVDLELAWWPLLRGELRLSGVRVVEPRLRLARDESGRANWDGLLPESETGEEASRWRLIVRDFAIEDGLGVYVDREAGTRWVFGGVSLALSGPEGNRTVDLSVESFGNPDELEFLAAPWTVRARTVDEGERTRIEELLVTAGPLRLEGEGILTEGGARLTRGRLAHEDGSEALEDLAGAARWNEDEIALTELTGRLGRSPFEANGSLRERRVTGVLRTHLDLDDLRRFFPPDAGFTMGGRVQGAIRFAGTTDDWSGIDVTGNANLHEISLALSDAPPARAIHALDGSLWADRNTISLSDLSGRLGETPFSGSVEIRRPLALLTANDPDRAPGDPVADVRFDLVTGALDGDALFPPGKAVSRMPSFRAEGRIRAERLRARKLMLEEASAELLYESGLTTLRAYSGRLYGGRLAGSGVVDYRVPEKPSYRFRTTGSSMEANALLSEWTPIDDLLHGRIEFDLNLRGTGFSAAEAIASLDARGLARAVEGRLAGARLLERAAEWTGLSRLNPMQFRDLLWRFQIRDGRVHLEETRIEAAGAEYLVAGSIGLDGRLGLEVAAAIEGASLGSLPPALETAAGAFRDDRGRLLLDFTVGGTLREPSFRWRTDRAAGRLAERFRDEARQRFDPIASALEDSLARARSEIEQRLEREAERQRQALEDEAERRKEKLEAEVRDLLRGALPSAAGGTPPPADTTPPPPASSPDSAAAGGGAPGG